MDLDSSSTSNLPLEVSDEEPSVLAIILDKQEAVQQTVSLIRSELAAEEKPKAANAEVNFKALGELIEDSRVETIIKKVAGEDTQSLIKDALQAINSNGSIDDKHKAFSEGILRLRENLIKPDKLNVRNNSSFDLAVKLAGLNKNKFF